MLNLAELFDKYEDEFLRFESVEKPRHPRPDLCAFLMLDELAGTCSRHMVDAAEHDEIWLEADIDKVARNATEDQIVTLIRCGLRFDKDAERFCMFV